MYWPNRMWPVGLLIAREIPRGRLPGSNLGHAVLTTGDYGAKWIVPRSARPLGRYKHTAKLTDWFADS